MIDFHSIYSQYNPIIKAGLVLVIGLLASKLISSVSGKIVTTKFGSHIGGVTRNNSTLTSPVCSLQQG